MHIIRYRAFIICYYLLLTYTHWIFSIIEDTLDGRLHIPKPKKPKTARWQRIAMMDKEIVDVKGAATLLGVSTTTIYNLARKGEIPATRVGREWRFARANLIQWVANGAAADQLSVALSRGRVAKRK